MRHKRAATMPMSALVERGVAWITNTPESEGTVARAAYVWSLNGLLLAIGVVIVQAFQFSPVCINENVAVEPCGAALAEFSCTPAGIADSLVGVVAVLAGVQVGQVIVFKLHSALLARAKRAAKRLQDTTAPGEVDTAHAKALLGDLGLTETGSPECQRSCFPASCFPAVPSTLLVVLALVADILFVLYLFERKTELENAAEIECPVTKTVLVAITNATLLDDAYEPHNCTAMCGAASVGDLPTRAILACCIALGTVCAARTVYTLTLCSKRSAVHLHLDQGMGVDSTLRRRVASILNAAERHNTSAVADGAERTALWNRFRRFRAAVEDAYGLAHADVSVAPVNWPATAVAPGAHGAALPAAAAVPAVVAIAGDAAAAAAAAIAQPFEWWPLRLGLAKNAEQTVAMKLLRDAVLNVKRCGDHMQLAITSWHDLSSFVTEHSRSSVAHNWPNSNAVAHNMHREKEWMFGNHAQANAVKNGLAAEGANSDDLLNNVRKQFAFTRRLWSALRDAIANDTRLRWAPSWDALTAIEILLDAEALK